MFDDDELTAIHEAAEHTLHSTATDPELLRGVQDKIEAATDHDFDRTKRIDE